MLCMRLKDISMAIPTEFKFLFEEIGKTFRPEAIERMEVLLTRLFRKVEDLSVSRDNWKRKYKELKSNVA